MAIVKRVGIKAVSYQVRVKGNDGLWISASYSRRSDAERHEAKPKSQKADGFIVSKAANQILVCEYFEMWDLETKDCGVSVGWRKDQIRYFKRFIEPEIGKVKLQQVRPLHVARVLRRMSEIGLSSQMQLHVFNILHKMFEDAIEIFQILNRNSAIKKVKPSLKHKEPKYLTLNEMKKLVTHIKASRIETAVLLQFFAGLRVGEVQALKWKHIDFERNRILVEGTYVRKEGVFRDNPKGGDQHWVPMTVELREHLMNRRKDTASPYVASDNPDGFLNYDGYYKGLRSACEKIGITPIGTHGLRHSTSELYLENGASVYDVSILFDHSDLSVTEGYMHDRGGRLEKITNVIRLFPKCESAVGVSQKFPKPSEHEGSSTGFLKTVDAK